MSVIITGGPLDGIVKNTVQKVEAQVVSRTYQASNKLRSAALRVLRGQRSGVRYRVPHTYRHQKDKASGKMRSGRYYASSAPGSPPAVRTGAFRGSWMPKVKIEGSLRATATIESDLHVGKYLLGALLEDGTSNKDGTPKMEPRPYKDAIKAQALPGIVALYKKPYV